MSQSGFFDLPKRDYEEPGFFERAKREMCRDPQHEPPSHLHIPRDKGYRHVCPACGSTRILVDNIGW